ncbi:hypothetical protein Tco_1500069 [Tanacetum coccineum]
MSKVLQERGFGSLPRSSEINPRDHVKSISTTFEADMTSIRRIRSPQYVGFGTTERKLNVRVKKVTIVFLNCLNDYYCNKKKGSYGLQFLDAYSYGATRRRGRRPGGRRRIFCDKKKNPSEDEDDMEINIEEDENEPELTYPYEEVDPLNPPPPSSESEPDDEIEIENQLA